VLLGCIVGLRWICTAHGTALQRLEREREYLETMWEKAEQDVDSVEHNHEQLSAVQASLSVQQQSAATSLNAVMESFRKEVHKVQQKQARLTEQRQGLASNQTKMQERLDEHYLTLVERQTDVTEARRVRRYDDAASWYCCSGYCSGCCSGCCIVLHCIALVLQLVLCIYM
jgi:chromosome segregation ATPase